MGDLSWLSVVVQVVSIIVNILIVACGFLISWGKINEVIKGVLARLEKIEIWQTKFEEGLSLRDGRSKYVLRSELYAFQKGMMNELQRIRKQNEMLVQHFVKKDSTE